MVFSRLVSGRKLLSTRAALELKVEGHLGGWECGPKRLGMGLERIMAMENNNKTAVFLGNVLLLDERDLLLLHPGSGPRVVRLYCTVPAHKAPTSREVV